MRVGFRMRGLGCGKRITMASSITLLVDRPLRFDALTTPASRASVHITVTTHFLENLYTLQYWNCACNEATATITPISHSVQTSGIIHRLNARVLS